MGERIRNKPLSVENLNGTFVPLITPMDNDGKIDYNRINNQLENLISAGIEGIVACSAVGQMSSLSKHEHAILAAHICKQINGRVNFIVAANSGEKLKCIDMILGATTYMLDTSDYFNQKKVSDPKAYFAEIMKNSLPNSNFILYNTYSWSGSRIEPHAVVDLSKNRKIIGMIDAVGDIPYLREIIEHTKNNGFRVLSGTDYRTPEIIKNGGYGALSTTGNVVPKAVHELTDASLKAKGNGQDYTKANKILNEITPLVWTINKHDSLHNPAPVIAYILGTNVRAPLSIPTTSYEKERIDATMAQYSNVQGRA